MFHSPLRFYQSCLRGASNREGLQPDVEEDYYRQAISGRPRGFGEGRQDRSDRGPLKGGAEHQQVPVCSRRRHLGALDERKFHTLPKQQAHPGDLTIVWSTCGFRPLGRDRRRCLVSSDSSSTRREGGSRMTFCPWYICLRSLCTTRRNEALLIVA